MSSVFKMIRNLLSDPGIKIRFASGNNPSPPNNNSVAPFGAHSINSGNFVVN